MNYKDDAECRMRDAKYINHRLIPQVLLTAECSWGINTENLECGSENSEFITKYSKKHKICRAGLPPYLAVFYSVILNSFQELFINRIKTQKTLNSQKNIRHQVSSIRYLELSVLSVVKKSCGFILKLTINNLQLSILELHFAEPAISVVK